MRTDRRGLLLVWLGVLATSAAAQQDELLPLERAMVQVVSVARPSIVPILVHRHLASSSNHRDCLFRIGSAVVVDAGGLLVSSAGMIQSDAQLEAVVGDRRWPARLEGVDSVTGLCALRVDAAAGLPPLARGDGESLQAGQFLAIFGYSQSVLPQLSMGIFDGAGQSVLSKRLDPFLQFTPLGLGLEQGGAVLDLKGRWVGFLAMPCEVSACLALPLPSVLQVVSQLDGQGEVLRPWLGMTIDGPNLRLGALLGLTGEEPLKVASVEAGSPAEAAGIAPGDRLLSFEGVKVATLSEMVALVEKAGIHAQVHLRLERAGQMLEKSLTIGSRSGSVDLSSTTEWLGLVLVDRKEGGLQIREVHRPVLAQWLGLRRDDVLLKLNGESLEDVRQLEGMSWMMAPDGQVVVEGMRDGQPFKARFSALSVRVDLEALLLRMLRLEQAIFGKAESSP